MGIRYGGLFEGIGAMAYAARALGFDLIWSNEINDYCCDKLEENFEHEIIRKDIREIGGHNLQPVDLVCGGFPCQPFSHAGIRRGKDDNRFLWPEMSRIIGETKPRWVVGENVPGLLTMEDIFEEICTDLEDQGYQVQAYSIPAGACGSMGKRDRLFILAHSEHYGLKGGISKDFKREDELSEVFSPRFETGGLHEIEEVILSKPGLCKNYDGLPRSVVKQELIAYGNAIDVRVAYEILRMIQIYEQEGGAFFN
ncbi:MAG: DNA (cytosine-5-)-methyltransferase [Cyclobacteriaceae bacterium]